MGSLLQSTREQRKLWIQSLPASESFAMSLSFCQVAKALELQLKHQSFQWVSRVDILQDWLVWSPCCPRDFSRVFSSTTIWTHQFLMYVDSEISYLHPTLAVLLAELQLSSGFHLYASLQTLLIIFLALHTLFLSCFMSGVSGTQVLSLERWMFDSSSFFTSFLTLHS